MMTWNGPGSLLIENNLVPQGGEISSALAEKMDADFLDAALADGRITKTEVESEEKKSGKKSAKSKSDEVPE